MPTRIALHGLVSIAMFLTIGFLVPATGTAQTLELRLSTMRAAEAGRQVVNLLATEIRSRLPDAQLRVLDTPEPFQQVLAEVRTGAIALAVVPLLESGATAAEPAVQPWQYSNAVEANRALNSEVGAIAAAQLEQTGVYALAFTTVAFSRLATRAPANAADAENLTSLRGQRVLAGPAQAQSARVIAQLGAQPMTLPAAEVVVALNRGIADAAIVVADEAFKTSGFVDVLKNYVDRPYQPVAVAIVVNKTIWRSLPYATQVGLSEAARRVSSGTEPMVESQERDFQAFLATRGATLVRLTAEGQRTAQQASHDAWAAANPGPRGGLLVRAVAASSPPRALAVAAAMPAASGPQTIFFATDRALAKRGDATLAFSGNSTTELSFGSVRVDLRNGRTLDEDLDTATTLTSIAHLSKDDFKAAVRQAAGDPAIFVHGYNNTFADAIRRAAAAKADFAYAGPVVVFSWPSDGNVPAYFSDEASIDVTSINFREFISSISEVADASRLSIVAHSMGSRIPLNYVDWAHGRPEFASRAKLKRIVFAASDVTMLYFRQLKEKLASAAENVTLYVSEHDRPLYASETLHSDVRLGRATGAAMFIERSMDSIDASDIDKTDWFSTRHSYVFNKPKGAKDLAALLGGKAALARTGLEKKERGASDIYYRIIP